ncbi:hypothetical protein BGZ83_007897 [Gryganskiella cystojenkinii]|nr:hypothetical protein BGZ83_007897 [Gryganskiella cystojenkinii]
MEPLGGWSRRLVCNYTTEGGSVYSVVKKAHDEGFGIVILNPNAQYWVDGQAEVQNPANRKQHILIPNLESPEKHVSYVLGNILRPTPCKEFFFIGHKYGCHSLMTALLEQFETFKNRVSAIALIEGTNSLHDETLKDFRKWWSLNAVGYAQSEVSEKGIIDYNVRMGCNCVRAGTEEFDATLLEAMPLINRFFAKRLDRDNTFDRYKDVLQPPVEDDPTTALITFDAEEMEPDETWPVDPEEADASWT